MIPEQCFVYDPMRRCATARCESGHVAVGRGDLASAASEAAAKLVAAHPDCDYCEGWYSLLIVATVQLS